MSFLDFAMDHGLDIKRLEPSRRIQRCGTREKPRSDNGAYFWDGIKGWVMDWAVDTQPVHWRSKECNLITRPAPKPTFDDRDERARRAAKRAEEMLSHAELAHHDYLARKGLPEAKGLVLEGRLLVPMRNVRTRALQGLQTIWWDPTARVWEKKMIAGMRAKAAVLRMGTGSESWLVEGYATGLSVHAALRSMGSDAGVVVTFSAGNLVEVADKIPGRRFVFADHDASRAGQQAAETTGLPWVMSDVVGEDANDLHKRAGLFSVVRKLMDGRLRKVSP
jgi:putative DNA primase/helicase